MSAAVTRSEVVIVGGGAGGAELAAALGRRFGRKTMNVTLVDCTMSHLWKPRLHEVAAGLIGAGEDETSYLAIGWANNFRFRLGALTGLDPVAKTISISAVTDAEGGDSSVTTPSSLPLDLRSMTSACRVLRSTVICSTVASKLWPSSVVSWNWLSGYRTERMIASASVSLVLAPPGSNLPPSCIMPSARCSALAA